MELRHIYGIANAINKAFEDEGWKDNRDDLMISVMVSPTTHYGIDKEFYRQTHDGSIEGFERSDELIFANIDGIVFKIVNKKTEEKN